jgi:hypothetical protein
MKAIVRKNVIVLIVLSLLLTLFILADYSTVKASDTIAGKYSITNQKGQRVTVQWSCGNCGKSCGKSTLTWPSEGTTSSRSFSCGKCKKRNKVTLYGRNY